MPRRRNPLVCQYIENLSRSALQEYADIIREIVGRRHGVYALYRRDKLYYVGLATNLRNRLRAHLKDDHGDRWDRFSVYLTIDHKHLKDLESLVIRIAQPSGNKQRGKFARSENMTRALRQRVKQTHRAQLLELLGKELESLETDGSVRRRGKRRRERGKPVLAGYLSKAMTLRAKYKKVTYKARVRKNGTIRLGKEQFNSPSLAATAVVQRPANGWDFWTYERAPGQWVKLRELRRR
jgi:hypothetical protein